MNTKLVAGLKASEHSFLFLSSTAVQTNDNSLQGGKAQAA